jgi:exopolyphosphatase/guanosine-5'-triphosphate,3'-diphosphate pyrophosphatase
MASAQPVKAARGDVARRTTSPQLGLLRGGGAASSSASERTAAVIDLGSNSWRLVVYAYRPGASWRRVGELHEPVRIAEGLSRSGRLNPSAIARGLETLEMFARYLDARGTKPGEVDAVATSAIRDAVNGPDLLAEAQDRTGLAITVLSAEEEAHLGYLAAVNSTTLTDGVVLDLGGGSLQLTAVTQRQAEIARSWPLGAVRVTDQLFPRPGAVSRKQLKHARAVVREALETAPWLADSGRRLVAMGGAVRNLGAAAQRASGHTETGIQGYVLERAVLHELVRELAKRPAAQRALPGIKASRADIVLGAAVVLESVLDLGGFDGIEVTRAGLREGVFFSRRLLGGPAPLLADVRVDSIRNLALQFDADMRHADHVARLALQLHDSLVADGLLGPDPDERGLLWAAALLHDIGVTIGYDGHTGHAHYLILKAELAGYGPREIALIAQIVRHHRKGTPTLDELRPLTRNGDAELVARCALLLRLAEQLDSGQDQSVREARLVAERHVLHLRLRGDDRLARWSLERRLCDGAFERVFGRRLVLTP